MNGFVLFSATTFIYFTYHTLDQVYCEVTQPRAGLQRDPNNRFRYAQFIEHFHHVLDVLKIEGVDVQTGRHCLLLCVKNDRCFSTNVGTFHLPNGNVSCELLPTDKYNASEKFKANHTFHHYSILSPCESFPCQHGGTCRALYETNDYNCGCTQNYTGRNCETQYLLNCDCWRSRSRSGQPSWGYSSTPGSRIDAIDFQTSGNVNLKGYRLWGVIKSGSATYTVTIRLYQGSSLIAVKSGSYFTRSSDQTFEVFFPQEISVRAGVVYTATADINTGHNSFALNDGMNSASCSGVTVTFSSSSKDSNGSSMSSGQIPALIFRAQNC